jgi:two-component system, OmpR family, sensor kinase
MHARDRQRQAVSRAAASELAELRQLVAELRDSVRARDDFIAIAVHELRNPMAPMLGIAQLALTTARNAGDTCPPRVTALLERMQGVAQTFIKRATQLLDVSRIETGNLRLEPAVTDLSALVNSIAQRYDAAAARGRSALHLDVENKVAGLLDRLAVEQVIENLLSNALKFGMGQPVTLRLRLEGQLARLEVQDRGIGMNLDQQKRIFERFEQVMAQHRGGGFGIGLWVASRLVAAMDGRISVSSLPGEGATFTVRLPLFPPGSGSTDV